MSCPILDEAKHITLKELHLVQRNISKHLKGKKEKCFHIRKEVSFNIFTNRN